MVLVNYFEEKKEKEKDIEAFWDKRTYVQELFSKVCLKKKKVRFLVYNKYSIYVTDLLMKVLELIILSVKIIMFL